MFVALCISIIKMILFEYFLYPFHLRNVQFLLHIRYCYLVHKNQQKYLSLKIISCMCLSVLTSTMFTGHFHRNTASLRDFWPLCLSVSVVRSLSVVTQCVSTVCVTTYWLRQQCVLRGGVRFGSFTNPVRSKAQFWPSWLPG